VPESWRVLSHYLEGRRGAVFLELSLKGIYFIFLYFYFIFIFALWSTYLHHSDCTDVSTIGNIKNKGSAKRMWLLAIAL